MDEELPIGFEELREFVKQNDHFTVAEIINQYYIPQTELEDLIEAWREQAREGDGIDTSTYLKTRATYYRRCANELEAVIGDE